MFEDLYTYHNSRALDDALVLIGGDVMREEVLRAYTAIDTAEFRGALAGSALGLDVGRVEAEAGEFDRTSEATEEAYSKGYAAGYQVAEKLRHQWDMNGLSEDWKAYGRTFAYPLQADQPHMHFEQDDAFGNIRPESYDGFRFER